MSRHLDGSPKPADTIAMRADRVLALRCPCGHAAEVRIGETARRFGVGPEQRVWELCARLRCSRCGGKEARVAVR